MSAHRPFQIGVLTLSDKGSQGQRVDESGPVVEELLAPVGEVVHVAILPDDIASIATLLIAWTDQGKLDLIDEIPGMAEAMRMQSLQKTPHAMVSRAVVGVRKQTMIINLPGSPKAARENLETLLPALPHALAKLTGDPSDCA
jgi:molybdopterin biosynthesis enzyme MoaB